MRTIIITAFSLIMASNAFAQSQVDTLYYDSNWKGADSPLFATYYRITQPNENPNYSGRYRDFWMDGTLCGEGKFFHIDTNDATNSIYDGECIQYYKNGEEHTRKTYRQKKLNGKMTEYAPNGLVVKERSYKNGRLHGLYTEFLENGNFKQLEYNEGLPKTEFYYIGNPDGQMSRYYIKDHSIYWEEPSTKDQKEVFRKGEEWNYYIQNGLSIATKVTYVKEYGKWFKVDIIISNNSTESLVFDPDYNIYAYSTNKNGEMKTLDVWPAYQYLNKVRRRHNTAEFFAAVGEAMQNYNAAYSTSTTTTVQNYGGQINSYGVNASVGAAAGVAAGSGGYAVGAAVGASVGAYANTTNYSGSSITTTSTVTYDAAIAYQQQALSQQKMREFHNANWEERQSIEKGYLEKTTIFPGETVSGYVYIPYTNGSDFDLIFTLFNCKYKFRYSY